MTFSLVKSVLALIWLLVAHAILAEGPGKQDVRPGRAQTIYRCRIAGVSTFSDHPCGDTIEQYDAGIGRLSILDSPPVPARTGERVAKRAPPSAGTATKASEGATQAAKTAACQRSQQSLRKIRAQMRTGYSAKQGERLRTRKKNLEEQRHTLGC